MLCFVALIVFSLMGIFSAAHRQLALRALDCVFRRLTIRPCNTGFKEEVKGKLLGFLLRKSPILAKIFNNHFEFLAWIFFILSVTSAFWVGKGVYNFYYYGSCNGLNQSGFCAFDPRGESNKVSVTSGQCSVLPQSSEYLTLANFDKSLFPTIENNSKNNIVFIGCFNCHYSHSAYPLVKKLVNDKKTNFTFAHYPINSQAKKLSVVDYCAFEQDKEKYWSFLDKMFSIDNQSRIDMIDENKINSLLTSVGYDLNSFTSCVNASSTAEMVDKQIKNIETTGLYGTPTVFVNDTAIVGPKPERVYRLMLK